MRQNNINTFFSYMLFYLKQMAETRYLNYFCSYKFKFTVVKQFNFNNILRFLNLSTIVLHLKV